MRIVHLSDLHFGTEIVDVSILIESVKKTNPALIVITGDFTQRATHHQYKLATKFIQSLNHPNIVMVPGNHDISLHNPFERFFLTFNKYRDYIADNLNPFYANDDFALLGVNSVTPFRVQDGLVTKKQLRLITNFFQNHRNSKVKIVAMHHNMIRPDIYQAIDNLEEILQVFVYSGVNLILSGHLHDAVVEQVFRPYLHYNMYAVTAGTALSHRLRNQANSFNLIEVDAENFIIQVIEYKHGAFQTLPSSQFLF